MKLPASGIYAGRKGTKLQEYDGPGVHVLSLDLCDADGGMQKGYPSPPCCGPRHRGCSRLGNWGTFHELPDNSINTLSLKPPVVYDAYFSL